MLLGCLQGARCTHGAAVQPSSSLSIYQAREWWQLWKGCMARWEQLKLDLADL